LVIGRLKHGCTLTRAAEAAGVSVRTISKWRCCYRAEGELGLRDRNSALVPVPHRTPADRTALITFLSRKWLTTW